MLRRIKSGLLRSDVLYRACLKWRYGTPAKPARPSVCLLNGVLMTCAEGDAATAEGRRFGLPLHRGPEKNWDHLAAVFTILRNTSPNAQILDAGAELYSNVLPALFAYGYRDLYGINLDFAAPARRGPIRYLHGDITQSQFDDGFFDAIACLSVIEHGVPLAGYFREMHRILKPGGLLITSTDYFPTPIDTRGQSAHGSPIQIFSKPEILAALDLAYSAGFESTGPLDLATPEQFDERPIHWAKFNLDYTFLLFTLRKKSDGAADGVVTQRSGD
jgi:SAM-dependent methyltransferase